METQETLFKGFKMNGFVMLFIHLIVVSAAIAACFIQGSEAMCGIGTLLSIAWCVLFAGYMQLEPNEARAMVFFGNYKGTFRKTGFFFTLIPAAKVRFSFHPAKSIPRGRSLTKRHFAKS